MQTNILLALVCLTLCSMGPTMPIAKNKRVVEHSTNNTNTSLQYAGTMTGYMNIGVTARIEVDSSTGIRYEVWFQGPKISSHIGIFYKFSDPHRTIIYNFATHQSQMSQGGGAIDNHPVSVMGMDSVNHYFCTHLQQAKNNETQDFWMSTSVPGFAQVVGALNSIDPNLQMMVIVQSIFKWGGLVRLRWVAATPQQETTTFTLNLIEAKTGVRFRVGEFDVPK